jgi:hypothetical protein
VTHILAIDPGPTRSACVWFEDGRPLQHGIWDNRVLRHPFVRGSADTLVIEEVAHYGMPVGRDVFQTVRWAALFEAAFGMERTVYVPRAEVKLYLCGSPRATDATVRQALIDRYGGDEVAIGGKKCPVCKGRGSTRNVPCETCKASGWAAPKGPLYGIATHCWSALALAVTYSERGKK